MAYTLGRERAQYHDGHDKVDAPIGHEVALNGVNDDVKFAGRLLSCTATPRVFAHPLGTIYLDGCDGLPT